MEGLAGQEMEGLASIQGLGEAMAEETKAVRVVPTSTYTHHAWRVGDPLLINLHPSFCFSALTGHEVHRFLLSCRGCPDGAKMG